MLAITYETGQLLHSLVTGIKAKNILELGTSTGYSTLWLADAVLTNHANPRITTIEKDPAKILRASENFKKAGISKIIQIKKGQILDVLASLGDSRRFDFVLVDADKENAKKYASIALSHLNVGGIMVTDNMLYPTKYRQIMREYSSYLSSRKDVQTCTVPIGNGEEITVKMRS